MKNYNSYMDRREISPEAHQRLLELKDPKPRHISRVKYGALAACAVLMIGVGAWKLAPRPQTAPVLEQSAGQFAANHTPLPGEKDVVGPDDLFVVNSPADEDQVRNFFFMPAIQFPDITDRPETDASRAYTPGTFLTDLTKEDVQKLFWGPEGKPEDTGYDLPWALFWDGYAIHGYAWYDGQGQLMELTVYGDKGRAGFELELRMGALPFACCIDMSRGDVLSEFNGVSIAGWSKVYDRAGDGEDDYICGSEFMTENGVGVRFTSWNSGKEEDGIGGEARFNTLFVRQALTGGLHLDHLKTNENIPAWREESFSTLTQARQEGGFAPYLPTKEPEGYSSYIGSKEFYGRLSYQEGCQNMLFVRWSRGYDDVEVCVYRDGYCSYNLADPAKPETYDLRLYSIPWCDSVPREYRDTVNSPAFRAEDISSEIVEARCHEKDTGGLNFRFDVLHPDGTLVSYRCDGMTVEQVWEMVKETL